MAQVGPRVMAGPLGFLGNCSDLVIGPCRQTKDEALKDAHEAADLLDFHPHIAPHAWREVWK